MISLDDRLEGEVLCLRPSMIKFESNSNRIEICGAGFKPLNMYLNRQLIKILEDLGVPDRSFLDLQNEAVEQLRITTENPINAGYYLQRNDIGKAAKLSWLVRKLSYIGMSFSDDGFLRDTLELAVLIQLRKLKYRSRIYVERGMTVYGEFNRSCWEVTLIYREASWMRQDSWMKAKYTAPYKMKSRPWY